MFERVTGKTWASASEREREEWTRARANPLADLSIFASRDVWRGVMARKRGLDASAGTLYTAEPVAPGRWDWTLRDGRGRTTVVVANSDIPPGCQEDALVLGLQAVYRS